MLTYLVLTASTTPSTARKERSYSVLLSLILFKNTTIEVQATHFCEYIDILGQFVKVVNICKNVKSDATCLHTYTK